MKLMRNDPKRGGLCKYALIRLDKMTDQQIKNIRDADDRNEEIVSALINQPDLIEIGEPGTEDEFFAIKLKDQNARGALMEYAWRASMNGDGDLSEDVDQLADHAGIRSPWCKRPD